MCICASKMCIISAAMISGVCGPSAAVIGACLMERYLVLHGTLEEILEAPE